jgi:hypothetical protein
MATRTEQRPTRATKATKPRAKAAKPRAKAAVPDAAASGTTASRATKAASRTGRQSDTQRRANPPQRQGGDAVNAADRAISRDAMRIQLPVLGEFRLPAADELVFLGGIAALTALGLVEWPVALLLGAGHELATSKHHSMLRNFGEALEAA